jgi:hypothetical protein
MGHISGYRRKARGIVIQRDRNDIQSDKRALTKLLGGIGKIRRNNDLINHSRHGIGTQSST